MTTLTYVYVLYEINKYPECHEPDKVANSIFTHKRKLLKRMKDLGVMAQYYKIEKVRVNRLFEM